MTTSALDPALRETNVLQMLNYTPSHKDTYPFISPLKSNLTGRSVLITGASKGIGKATAISFARAGCSKILLAARSDLSEVESAVKDAAKKAERAEPLVRCLRVDVTEEGEVSDAAGIAEGVLGDGGLDVLISNAGNLEQWVPIAESDPSTWWRTWEVNIKGTYLFARYFVPLLLKSQLKTLITISSGGAHALFPGASAYQTTKFAQCRLTEFIDKEYYQQGLIAIAVHPGAVKTELSMNMPVDRQNVLTDMPELAGDTCVWLGRERREWLAGRFVSVSWDMEVLEGRRDEVLRRNSLKFRMGF